MSYVKEQGLKEIILQALKEDIGIRDITTESVIPAHKLAKAVILVKEDCVVCGLNVAKAVFRTKDRKIKFKPKALDGQRAKKGKIIAEVQGKARSILTAERVALNFLSLFSGIATKTRQFVEIVKPYKVKIMDTRKTIPGLRQLQKYAVRIGGGYNHRFRLDEMVLIKDNHLKVINPKSQFPNPKQIPISKSQISKLIEIEVKNLKEFKAVLKLNPDIIMLDNMSIKDIRKAVRIRNYQLSITNYQLPKLEASGGVTLKNVRQIAKSGVDFISIGSLTHSVESVDVSLEIL